jgi:hypothetical protein
MADDKEEDLKVCSQLDDNLGFWVTGSGLEVCRRDQVRRIS